MNIGTLFTTPNGNKYRANQFLRIETYSITGDDAGIQVLREILVEEGKDPDNLHRLIYCAPDEATLVSGSGVCGCIVHMSEVTVEGMVDWSDELLTQMRDASVSRYGRVADVGEGTLARLVASM